MSANTGKYFFIPDWLLQENSQTIHAYIYILNEINSNAGELKTSSIQISKDLNISRQQARLILDKITARQPTNNQQITNKSTNKNTLLSIDFIGVVEDVKKANKQPNNKQTTNKQLTKQPLKERKKAFIESLKTYADLYDKDMLNDFYRYWVETDPKEQKMRFELQKTWQLNLRLITWKRNNQKQFNAKTKPEKPKEEKIGRTSIETIKKNAEYNGQY